MLCLHGNYSNKNKVSRFVHNCKQIISLKKPSPQSEKNELQENRYQTGEGMLFKYVEKPGDSASCFWYHHICRLSSSGMLLLCNYLLKDLKWMFWKDFAEQLEFSLFLNLATAFMCRVFRTPLAEAGRWWNQELQMFLMKSVGSKHLRNLKNLVSMICGIISGWKKQCNAWYGFRVQCKLIISWGFLEISLAFQNTLLFQGLLSVSIKYSSFSLEELHSNLQNWLFNDTSKHNLFHIY